MKKRFGFTLAEVLITLGIIGVVAAMTIPTLIQNTNSVRFATQFKKTISTLSQAALMSQAQYDIDYALADQTVLNCRNEVVGAVAGENEHTRTICGILNATLAGQTYLGEYGDDHGPRAANGADAYTIDQEAPHVLPALDGWFVYALADGSLVGINKNAVSCNLAPGTPLNADALAAGEGSGSNAVADGGLRKCLGFVDVNGPTPPNKEVVCANAASTTLDPSVNCELQVIGGAGMGDVFPIVFHNGTAEPASNAAKMALTRGK